MSDRLKRIITCVSALTFLFSSILPLLFSSGINRAYGDSASYEEYKEPTCIESGYRLIEEGEVSRLEVIPATGHQFTDWIMVESGNKKKRTCTVCGYEEEIRASSIAENTIPRLDLKGSLEGIGKKNRVILQVAYQSRKEAFQCNGILTLQGHSTYGLPKKNYTIRFYDDTDGTLKHKLAFKNWNREHKFILKANYADLSQCRNLAGAHIWTNIVQNRENVHDRIAMLPTYGAVDGFPVAVYLNDTFFGLYTLNLHKDDDLFQMKKGRKEALLICNLKSSEEAFFQKPAVFAEDYSSDWEIEFCGTEDESWAKESFNDFIQFVMESDDKVFREHLEDHLDVDAAIDYLLFIYALGLENSGSKDMVMLSYDGKWIPSAYDMDEAFGLDYDRAVYRSPDEFLPSMHEGKWVSGTGSLLWDRILNQYWGDIQARYVMLRNRSLSNDFLISCVHEISSQIPESFYDMDYCLYPERPINDLYMEAQIETYIHQRMDLMDNIFGGNI